MGLLECLTPVALIVIGFAIFGLGWLGGSWRRSDLYEKIFEVQETAQKTQDILRGLSHEEAKRHKEEMAKD